MGWITRASVRPYVASVCGLILVVGLSIVERLDAALAAMHRVGDVTAGFGTVAAPSSLWSAQSAQAAIRAWGDWDADRLASDLASTVMSARQTVVWFAVIDTLVVALPVAVLLWLLGGWARDLIRERAMDLTRMRERERSERHDSVVRARALCQVASTARLVALVHLALDTLENLSATLLIESGSAPALAVQTVGLVSLLKLVTLTAAAMPLLLIVIAMRSQAGRLARAVGRRLILLRGQLVVMLAVTLTFLALGGDIGVQVDDVIMRWAEQPVHAVAAVLAALILTTLLAQTGFTRVDEYAEPPAPVEKPLSPWLLAALGGGGIALAAAGLAMATLARFTIGYMLVFPGAALALFAVLSSRKAVRAVKPPPPGPAGESKVPAVLIWALAAAPLAVLGLVIVRSAVTLAVTRAAFQGFAVLGLGLIAAAVVLVVVHRRPGPGRRARRLVVLAVTVVALLTAAAAAVQPIPVGGALGTVAVLMLLLIVVLLIFTGLQLAGDALAPRGALALLRLRRTPLIALAIVWFSVTSLIDRGSHYHDVRLGAELPKDYKAVTVDEAFNAWLAAQHGGPVVEGKQRVPMLFIATAGGGIRSAYWTGLILDCLFAEDPLNPACAGQRIDRSAVFAASGISGGSLGLAIDRALEGSGGKFTDVLERDYLSPDMAALAFRDMPNYLLRLEPDGADRAGVMENAWESAFPAENNPMRQGFFAAARDPQGKPRFPLLLLNSATIDDGCRLNGSTLDASARVITGPVPPLGTEGCLTLTPFEPGREEADNPVQAEALAGSKDLFQYICRPETPPDDPAAPDARQPVKYDIPLSAVAHLSGRFPYISPSGALTSCSWPQRRTYALDGGLLEASAVSPLTEVWTRLAGRIHEVNDDPAGKHCIEPRLLMIDNGYAAAASTRDGDRPAELIAPATGLSRFSASWGARAEQAAALAFDHAFGAVACRGPGNVALNPENVESRVAHIVPTARPGPRAPLGWSLSQYARSDLTTQARSPANMCQIALVRSWVAAEVPPGGMRCVTGFAVRADTASTAAVAPPIAMFAPPIPVTALGVPGVRVAVSTGESGCAHGTTTDASGRFYLLVPAGPPAELAVCWKSSVFTVTLPSGNSPLVTSDNFAVTVEGEQEPNIAGA
jgi:hypothetical protein